MYLQQFFVEGLGHASYLIGSDSTNEAAVVDPNRNVDVYLEAALSAGLRIRYILETHVHNDFLSGAKPIADKLGAQYVASAESGLTFAYRAVREGDEIELGELRIRVLFTPGHTPEHVSYVVTDTSRAEVPVVVFTGGDLLVGAVGRPDLLGRELGEKLAPQLYDSLFDKLLKLEDYVEVMPTHGAGSLCGRSISTKRTTTIGYERRFNQALQKTDRQEFIDFVLDGNPFVPPYYKRMRPGNMAGTEAFAAPPPRPLPAGEVQHALGHGAIVVDTRAPSAFGGGHIDGSINVGKGAMLATWTGSLLPANVPMILVLERGDDWDEIVAALGRIGYEQIVGYLQGGISAWAEAGLPLARIEQIDVAELDRRRKAGEVEVLDVRMDAEWQAGHVPGARHIQLNEVADRVAEIDASRPVAVICGSGYRSSIAGSILAGRGIQPIINVLGGMSAWNAAGLETERPGLPTQRESTDEVTVAAPARVARSR